MAPPTEQAAASAYGRALNLARQRGYAIGREQMDSLLRSFGSALADITADQAEGRITPERAGALRSRMQNVFLDLEEKSYQVTLRGMDLTVRELVEIHHRANVQVGERLAPGMKLGALFDTVPTRVVAAIAARRGNAANMRSLFQYRFQAAATQVDTLIESGLARGVGSGQMSRDLAQLLGGPELAGKLPSGSRLRMRLGNIDLKRYGIPESQVADAKALLYNARRIAATEQGNAMREANTQALVASPVVAAARWQRSGRHNHVDECDALSTVDWYGLGAGMHWVERWPHAPHPFCMCMQGGPVQMRPVSEWRSPRPERASSLMTEQAIRDQYQGKLPEGALDRMAKRAAGTVRSSGTVNVPVGDPNFRPKPPVAPPAPAPAPRKRTSTPRKKAAPTRRPDQLSEDELTAQMEQGIRAWKPTAVKTAASKLVNFVAQVGGQAIGQRYGRGGFAGVSRVQTGVKSNKWLAAMFPDGTLKVGTRVSDELRGLAGVWDGQPIDPARLQRPPAPSMRDPAFIPASGQGIDFRAFGVAQKEWEQHPAVLLSAGASALKTVVHELNHARIPANVKASTLHEAWEPYQQETGRWLEEGMVELRARRSASRMLFARNYDDLPEHARHALGNNYPREVASIAFMERTAGKAAVDAIWEATTLRERARAAGEALKPALKEQVRREVELVRVSGMAGGSPTARDLVSDLDGIMDAIDRAPGERIGHAFEQRWDSDKGEVRFFRSTDLPADLTLAIQNLTGWIPPRFRNPK